MPYKLGHYYVGFVLLVTASGFWVSYFNLIGEVQTAFHVHAFTAMSWLLLLLVQSLAIHRRHNAFHKQMGLASLGLFPLLIIGFVMIINVSATRFETQESPFIAILGPAFGIGMIIAIVAYLTLFYLALRHRRNVRLHAGYMLATPMILFESPFSRVMDQFFPWMNFIGSEGPRELLDQIAISDAMVAIFALGLYFIHRKHGAPWLVAAFFVLLQAVVMWFTPDIRGLSAAFATYARIPAELTVTVGALAGVAAGYLGWIKGRAPDRTNARPQPA